MIAPDPAVVRELEALVDDALRQYEDGRPVDVQDRINRLAEEWGPIGLPARIDGWGTFVTIPDTVTDDEFRTVLHGFMDAARDYKPTEGTWEFDMAGHWVPRERRP